MSTDQIHLSGVVRRQETAIPASSLLLLAIVIVGVVAMGVAVLGVVTGAFWVTILAGLTSALVTAALVFRAQLGE